MIVFCFTPPKSKLHTATDPFSFESLFNISNTRHKKKILITTCLVSKLLSTAEEIKMKRVWLTYLGTHRWWNGEWLLLTTHLNTFNEAETLFSYCMCVLFSTLSQPHTDIGLSVEKFTPSFSEEQFLSWDGNLNVLFRNLWSFLGSVKILDTSKGNEFWLERKRCLERLRPQILIW